MERVLIVEDSEMQARFLMSLLQQSYRVEICTKPEEALVHVRRFKPCLILMDIVMPEINGFELLAIMKKEKDLNGIPVILISGLSDVGDEKRGLDLGAVDYIVKPYSADIVMARVRTHVRIFTLQRSLEELMRMDALTGIFNRRYVEDCVQDQLAGAAADSTYYSLGIIDVDYFKKYNDHYGHLGGDAALRVVAQTAGNCLTKKGSFIARYGGEEFLFGLRGADPMESLKVAEEMRKKIMAAQIQHARSTVAPVITVSIGGLSGIPKNGEELKAWIDKADSLLYKAKAAGRNRVFWE